MKQANGVNTLRDMDTEARKMNGSSGSTRKMAIESAEALLPSKDIAEDIAFWTSDPLGFRMEQIYPADNPQVVLFSGHGLRIRLDKAATTSPGTIRLLYNDDHTVSKQPEPLTSPSGTTIEFASADIQFPQPPTTHTFRVGRLDTWIIGRAGMHYRDLIPSRLGGAIIASHIRIPTAGPVPDRVHYHAVGFQLIFCISGWVRLVYEDQGPPFILTAGDCVIQPPRIRHRVLESGEGLEVVEVGVPAEHATLFDWSMELPNGVVRREREWEGQRFVRSLKEEGSWGEWRVRGFEARDTSVGEGTRGVAGVRVVRPVGGNKKGGVVTSHDCDILFTFVLTGSCTLHSESYGSHNITAGDAYTLPPDHKTSLTDLSEDLTLLEVSLPAEVKTTVHEGEVLSWIADIPPECNTPA